MTENDVIIPPAFWNLMTEDEFKQVIVSGGTLDANLCERLWRMCGYTSTPPGSMKVTVNSEDVIRAFCRVR